ncbi:isochorismate synthase [Pseudochelatococcus contaminans]|uniref:isochorismate synthase n=1 Tax=Pseudochelatococcus contaminans TaxID=1538103 RepID=A0A7W6EE66_9HYPH|nr:isochorismate synthase [Pseudochelatococcus contaminans]MBB3808084.1 isochorismate synthase [Pseudochelatococcus contaminans]
MIVARTGASSDTGLSTVLPGSGRAEAERSDHAMVPFLLGSAEETIAGFGIKAALAPVPAEDLKEAERVFRAAHPDVSLIVGILPFDRAAPAHLYAPETVTTVWPARVADSTIAPTAGAGWSSAAEPPPAEYAAAVEKALSLFASEQHLQKVVLARSLVVTAPTNIDIDAVLARLARDRSITTFAAPLPSTSGASPRALIGATPELLVDKRGAAVRSAPLAGSARRHADKKADELSAAGLLASEKDLREHAFVVEAILDTLSPYCRDLRAPSSPSLVSTDSMWHLGTTVEGTLKDRDTPVIELAAALHPTPAVCGLPREAAREAIAALETVDRGYYAGAVGWTDQNGDGRWMVAIRCAEFSGRNARLFAGAGIVPGSDPWSEVAETSAKFSALLSALGIDETGSTGERPVNGNGGAP